LDGVLAGGKFGLVIIDPLNAYLGSGVDAFRDNEVRSVLGPLAQLAERHGVAVVCVSHLTKSRRDLALYRTQGSIGFVGAPRAILMAGQDAETGERAIVPIKVNIAELAPAVGYEIRDGVFYWLGESTLTAADILAPDREAGERSAVDEAVGFLRDALAEGPQLGKAVQREAAELGISGATLRRARERLGVQWNQPGRDGQRGRAQVMWSLPLDLVAHSETLNNQTPLVSENGQSGPLVGQPNPGPTTNGRTCKRCSQPLSAVAVGDLCGRCKAKAVTT
jgi:putative DNA primase/helicase